MYQPALRTVLSADSGCSLPPAGYARVAAALYAFAVALQHPTAAVLAYAASFVCDELDGRFARKLNQCSTLGSGKCGLGQAAAGWGVHPVHMQRCVARELKMQLPAVTQSWGSQLGRIDECSSLPPPPQ